MQAAMALYKLHDALDSFTNPIANDQKKKLSARQVTADVIHKNSLVKLERLFPGKFIQDIAPTIERFRYFSLQILVAP